MEEATKEYNSALEILTKYLEPNNRKFADTYYDIGKALKLANKYSEAADYFKKAENIYKHIIGNFFCNKNFI